MLLVSRHIASNDHCREVLRVDVSSVPFRTFLPIFHFEVINDSCQNLQSLAISAIQAMSDHNIRDGNLWERSHGMKNGPKYRLRLDVIAWCKCIWLSWGVGGNRRRHILSPRFTFNNATRFIPGSTFVCLHFHVSAATISERINVPRCRSTIERHDGSSSYYDEAHLSSTTDGRMNGNTHNCARHKAKCKTLSRRGNADKRECYVINCAIVKTHKVILSM